MKLFDYAFTVWHLYWSLDDDEGIACRLVTSFDLTQTPRKEAEWVARTLARLCPAFEITMTRSDGRETRFRARAIEPAGPLQPHNEVSHESATHSHPQAYRC